MWVEHAIYRGYLVSESGELVRLINGYWETVTPYNAGGYLVVYIKLRKYCKRRVPIHRLVAETWVGFSHLTVDHLDENKLNNHYSNLEWVTRGENTRRAQTTKYYDIA